MAGRVSHHPAGRDTNHQWDWDSIMSDIDYSTVARTPLVQMRQLREMPIDQLVAFLKRCHPITRRALDSIFAAQ